ncbi:hypothetical protein NDU88_000016 [Pleurodeles waltl]|uniref:Uncharacterized protein n=1 Tax=Pleurodeles waltl TaxID=8319 RepID=A0AAV7WHR3_PLEWA|nr:hypothetical protein NDU88_000016 [Pleurodeles waltl]
MRLFLATVCTAAREYRRTWKKHTPIVYFCALPHAPFPSNCFHGGSGLQGFSEAAGAVFHILLAPHEKYPSNAGSCYYDWLH